MPGYIVFFAGHHREYGDQESFLKEHSRCNIAPETKYSQAPLSSKKCDLSGILLGIKFIL